MKKNFNEFNPELKEGDVIMLLHMDGESLPVGSRGVVKGKVNQPRFKSTDPGYGYDVEWYDRKTGKRIHGYPLLPEDDGWVFDKEYYESKSGNINESMFKDVDDLVSWGEFLKLFTKDELNVVCELFELERRSGFFNMALEGGKFILTGPEYIKVFLELKNLENPFSNEDKLINNAILSRAQEVKDIFIRAAMDYLLDNKQEFDESNIKRSMQRLGGTAKRYWMINANEYVNKKII
jgi:hypothetical protein